jgi:hypothetical protein
VRWAGGVVSHDLIQPRRKRVKRLALAVFALSAFLLGPSLALAQEATPAGEPGGIFGFPDPAECTVAPRTVAELEAIMATPAAATPEASPTVLAEMPEGVPADATTEAEVQATLREAVACINTGDTLKILQFYSDNLIRRLLAGASLDQLEQQGTPVPLTQAQQTELIAISGMVVLPDGRVAVVVTGDDHSNPAAATDTIFYFVKVGDRWLIDDFVTSVDIATPAP